VSASLTWRYIGSSSQDNNSDDATLHYATWGAYDTTTRKFLLTTYIDLQATWNVNKILQLRAGANNILDKDPPLVDSVLVSAVRPTRTASTTFSAASYSWHSRRSSRLPARQAFLQRVSGVEGVRAHPPPRMAAAARGPYVSIRPMELNQIKRFIKDLEERTDSLRRYL